MQEIFKDIEGYEGSYQVSNLGRVKSFKYKKERILKSCVDSAGYLIINLCKKGKAKNFSVHRLVAKTFLQKPRGWDIVVDHINNDRLDNRLENIQWITIRENNSKDRKPGTSKYVGVYLEKGRRKWRCRITIDGVKKDLGYFKTELEAGQAYQNKLKDILK
jgi:hypothetical protein